MQGMMNDPNRMMRHSDELRPAKLQEPSYDELRNALATTEVLTLELERLRAIEKAARDVVESAGTYPSRPLCRH